MIHIHELTRELARDQSLSICVCRLRNRRAKRSWKRALGRTNQSPRWRGS